MEDGDLDTYTCGEMDAFFARLQAESDKGNFIKPSTVQDSVLHIEYYDGLRITLLTDATCTFIQEFKATEWLTDFKFLSGGNSGPLKYRGDLMATTSLNPSGYSPLMCALSVNTRHGVRMRTVVQGKNGNMTDVEQDHGQVSDQDSVSVFGLYPDFENTIEVQVYSADGQYMFSETLIVQTGPMQFELPGIKVTTVDINGMQPGFTLVSERIYSNPSKPFMIDAFGECRWYLHLDEHPQLADLNYDTGMERLSNGNLYFGDKITDAIYEMNFSGEVLNRIDLAPYEYHHDVFEKPDGNFLVTATDLNSVHQNGTWTIEDFVIEINREGERLHVWDIKDYLDENRTTWDDNLNDLPIDWAHINSVSYDSVDNSIIVSCRLQGVIKIGYDDEIKWILGPHRGWDTNRRGEDLNEFLLQPLDEAGNAIANLEVLDGTINDPEFEWNWFQHAVDVLPNGDIILFDNGEKRNYTGDERYSRAVQYRIDSSEKTVKQIWDYGKERGEFGFSRLVSDVDQLENGNILYAPGFRVDNMNGEGAKLIELDPQTNNVLWEVEIESLGAFVTLHRAERMQF